MESMVERVARAIEGPHLPVPEGSKYTLDQLREARWGIMSNNARARRLNEARAAIEATRDAQPTKKMMEAMWSLKFSNTPESFAVCWQALIDAALNEQVSE